MSKKNTPKTITLRAICAIIITLAVLTVCTFGFSSLLKTLYPMKFTNTVEKYAEQYNLSKFFVYAVIECESGFDEKAVSPVGARGLMQIMPDTFDWINMRLSKNESYDKAFEAETSVEYGCYFYSYLMDKYEDEAVCVAAYHAGMGNVDKWLCDERYSLDGKTLYDIPFPSTEKYVKKVVETKKIYEKIYGED